MMERRSFLATLVLLLFGRLPRAKPPDVLRIRVDEERNITELIGMRHNGTLNFLWMSPTSGVKPFVGERRARG